MSLDNAPLRLASCSPTSHPASDVWRGCRQLWDVVYTLGMGCVQGSVGWSKTQQDTEDLTHINNTYCMHLADTGEGEDSGCF